MAPCTSRIYDPLALWVRTNPRGDRRAVVCDRLALFPPSPPSPRNASVGQSWPGNANSRKTLRPRVIMASERSQPARLPQGFSHPRSHTQPAVSRRYVAEISSSSRKSGLGAVSRCISSVVTPTPGLATVKVIRVLAKSEQFASGRVWRDAAALREIQGLLLALHNIVTEGRGRPVARRP